MWILCSATGAAVNAAVAAAVMRNLAAEHVSPTEKARRPSRVQDGGQTNINCIVSNAVDKRLSKTQGVSSI